VHLRSKILVKLNAAIEHPLATGVFLLIVGSWSVASWLRFGHVYQRENLRDENRSLWIAALSPFDERIWSEEGLALHRQWFRHSSRASIFGLALWIVLDALW
jgi:hypothetical protein